MKDFIIKDRSMLKRVGLVCAGCKTPLVVGQKVTAVKQGRRGGRKNRVALGALKREKRSQTNHYCQKCARRMCFK